MASPATGLTGSVPCAQTGTDIDRHDNQSADPDNGHGNNDVVFPVSLVHQRRGHSFGRSAVSPSDEPPRGRPAKRRRQVRRRRRTLAAVVLLALVAAGAGILTQSGQRRAAATNALAPAAGLASTSSGYTITYPGGVGITSSGTTGSVSPTTSTAGPGRKPPAHRKPAAPASTGCSFDVGSARRVIEAEQAAGYRIGFALVTSTGRTLAAVAAGTPNYSASITKSMLLVAYLRDSAAGGLSAAARQELTAMIEVSDNSAADWVYEHLTSPAANVEQVAADAGMTGFHLDTSDPVYVLGQSVVTAGDFARFFSRIETFMPAGARQFGMSLLAGVQERVGLLAAGLPGVVYSKEGWKPEDAGALGAPYIVNQAGQFSCGGVTYGIAVTVGQAQDEASGESVVQRIAGALIH